MNNMMERLKRESFAIVKVDTKDMLAEFSTKPMGPRTLALQYPAATFLISRIRHHVSEVKMDLAAYQNSGL